MIPMIETLLSSSLRSLSTLSPLELTTAAGAFGYAIAGLWLMRVLDRESMPAEHEVEPTYRKAA